MPSKRRRKKANTPQNQVIRWRPEYGPDLYSQKSMPAQVKVGNEALHPHLRQASMTGKEKGWIYLFKGGCLLDVRKIFICSCAHRGQEPIPWWSNVAS